MLMESVIPSAAPAGAGLLIPQFPVAALVPRLPPATLFGPYRGQRAKTASVLPADWREVSIAEGGTTRSNRPATPGNTRDESHFA